MAAAEVTRRLVDLPSGDGRRRQLDIVEYGPPTAPLLVYHSGTPSGPALFELLAEAAVKAGYRYLNYGRPGYGRSSPVPGRKVAEAALDTVALVDLLGGGEFVALGWSGGGPHALACGALAAGRCRAVAVVAGIAPREAAGLDWYGGMGAENLEEFGLAERRDASFEGWLEAAAEVMRGADRTQMAEALGDLVGAPDRAALTGEVGLYLEDSFKSAVEEGIAGWRDDDYAFVGPWGFEPADCTPPTLVVQGSEDRMVPRSHGAYLASQIPGARYLAAEGEGHLSVWGGLVEEMVAFLKEAGG